MVVVLHLHASIRHDKLKKRLKKLEDKERATTEDG